MAGDSQTFLIAPAHALRKGVGAEFPVPDGVRRRAAVEARQNRDWAGARGVAGKPALEEVPAGGGGDTTAVAPWAPGSAVRKGDEEPTWGAAQHEAAAAARKAMTVQRSLGGEKVPWAVRAAGQKTGQRKASGADGQVPEEEAPGSRALMVLAATARRGLEPCPAAEVKAVPRRRSPPAGAAASPAAAGAGAAPPAEAAGAERKNTGNRLAGSNPTVPSAGRDQACSS
ncbi:hypothetical protein [Acidithiobacillus sulfuriphilus]|uniref:Uncharacterized protein n=2 Tax=Acidithiobacillus sulfuriphilus TaxID=1867749 RepID=A0ACD5HL82_9PROT